jgi:hypothetical protein
MELITLKLTGTTPLLMHSDTLANPLSPLTKEMKKTSGKRVKTDEDHELMAMLEFQAALYRDANGDLVMPSPNVHKCFIEGARISKDGAKIERGVSLTQPEWEFEFSNPNEVDVDKLFFTEHKEFVDTRSVKVGMTRIMRTRPRFEKWSVTVTVELNPAILNPEDLLTIAATAGRSVGLGDHRKIGGYGRFSVEQVTKKN